MLDVHFCDNSLLTYFNEFQVSEDLDSDHKIIISTMNLKNANFFRLYQK